MKGVRSLKGFSLISSTIFVTVKGTSSKTPYPQILHHVSIHETPRDIKAAFVAIKPKTSFHIK
ncbi:hypothetical protein Hanom_Chr06g00550581 [Helianthus anomalus]